MPCAGIQEQEEEKGKLCAGWAGRMHTDRSEPRVVPSLFPCWFLDLSNRGRCAGSPPSASNGALLAWAGCTLQPLPGSNPSCCPDLEGKRKCLMCHRLEKHSSFSLGGMLQPARVLWGSPIWQSKAGEWNLRLKETVTNVGQHPWTKPEQLNSH